MRNALLCSLATLLIFGCGKPDTKLSNNNLSAEAETKPQYDNTSFGVYKGVIIGSSGYIVFRINNGDNVVKGYLTIDDKKDILSTTETLVAGQPIKNVRFTGNFSSMTLNANADGNSAWLSDIKIDGHPDDVAAIIFHENSNQQVSSYEGKISGDLSGTINFNRIANNDTTFSIMKFKNNPFVYYGYGYRWPVSNDTIQFNFFDENPGYYEFKGILKNDQINGTWKNEVNGKNGSFSSVRTY